MSKRDEGLCSGVYVLSNQEGIINRKEEEERGGRRGREGRGQEKEEKRREFQSWGNKVL